MRKLTFITFILLLICTLWAQQPEFNLAEFSLQELADLKVTLVSKKQENFTQAAAAVFVVTQEDIQRSGATTIAEVLRMVPGMQVARIDANKWAITARGFIGRFSNKLLVLIDGRSVYSNLFSGVFWDMQDVLLEDVDRIEVIRGPGATLWGANAVNGIINIVTKNAKETQGGHFTAGIGTEEHIIGTFRYGQKLTKNAYLRQYIKYNKRDALVHLSGEKAADGWDVLRYGFRSDWNKTPSKNLTLQGNFHIGTIGHTLNMVTLDPPAKEITDFTGNVSGAHILFRWHQIYENASVLNIQMYADHMKRDEGPVKTRLQTFDMDLNYLFDLGHRHQIICGAGLRHMRDQYENTFSMSMLPNKKNQYLFNAFIQDDIKLMQDKVRFTVGSKIEHNAYTGFEVQPNIRMLWTPQNKHTFWTAVSRAVRTPSRAESGGMYIADILTSTSLTVPILFKFQGNPDFRSETLTTLEAGYRYYPASNFFLDITSFYNIYNHIFTGTMGTLFLETTFGIPHGSIPVYTDNKMAGNIMGSEVFLDYQISQWWHTSLAYTLNEVKMHLIGGSIDSATVENAEGQCPHHQVFLKSSMNFLVNTELDIGIRYVDALPELGIKSYINLDLRLGWHLSKKIRLDFIGQNLLYENFLEFIPEMDYTIHTCVQRGIYCKITWQF